VRAAPTEDLRA
jgi:hypothetical protein